MEAESALQQHFVKIWSHASPNVAFTLSKTPLYGPGREVRTWRSQTIRVNLTLFQMSKKAFDRGVNTCVQRHPQPYYTVLVAEVVSAGAESGVAGASRGGGPGPGSKAGGCLRCRFDCGRCTNLKNWKQVTVR